MTITTLWFLLLASRNRLMNYDIISKKRDPQIHGPGSPGRVARCLQFRTAKRAHTWIPLFVCPQVLKRRYTFVQRLKLFLSELLLCYAEQLSFSLDFHRLEYLLITLFCICLVNRHHLK